MAKKLEKLNMQALARGESLLMSTMIPPKDHVFISRDLCFPEYTEILTPRGWVYFKDLADTDLVWQVNKSTLNGSFVKPSRLINKEYSGDFLKYSTIRGSLEVTAGHTMLWVGQQSHKRKDKALYRKVTIAGNDEAITNGCHLCLWSNSNTISNFSYDEIDRMCAIAADSYYNEDSNSYSIEVSKIRKKDRLIELFGTKFKEFSIRKGHNLPTYRWHYIKYSHSLLKGKEMQLHLLGANQVDVFIECLKRWDGSESSNNSRTGRVSWSSSKKEEADKVQQYLVTSGYSAIMRKYEFENENWNTSYHLSIKNKDVIRFCTAKKTAAPSGSIKTSEILRRIGDEKVYCVTVPEGFILIRQNGNVFVSGNCAGEPTVICHYSQDRNYADAAFNMQNRAPYYAGDLLKISDIYLTGMSFSPMHKELMRELFHTKFGTVSFSEKWLEKNDKGEEIGKEFLQGQVKKQRKLSKIMILGLGYSMGPRKMVKQAYDNGYTVSLDQAKTFFKNYWLWAKDVKKFGDAMSRQFDRQGYLVNQFGFRLVPDKNYKALNYMIQSSVSGLMNILIPEILNACPHEKFVGIIHDELISHGPHSLISESLTGTKLAQDRLNLMLKWRVPMQVGFKPGEDLFTAK